MVTEILFRRRNSIRHRQMIDEWAAELRLRRPRLDGFREIRVHRLRHHRRSEQCCNRNADRHFHHACPFHATDNTPSFASRGNRRSRLASPYGDLMLDSIRISSFYRDTQQSSCQARDLDSERPAERGPLFRRPLKIYWPVSSPTGPNKGVRKAKVSSRAVRVALSFA